MARRGRRTSARAVFGVACLLFGLFLSARPFASVPVAAIALAVGLLLGAVAELIADGPSMLSRRTMAVAQVAAAAVIGLWPGLPLAAVAAVGGLTLVASGAVELWPGLSSRVSWVTVGGGAITVACGAVATVWADPVVLPIVIALGWRLVLVGAGLLVDLWYPPSGLGVRREARGALGRAVPLAVAVALAASTVAADPRPVVPSFYDAEPPSTARAGALLRAEAVPDAPAGAAALRLLYVTIETDGAPRSASALLYVPTATRSADLPLVVWAHRTTGIARSCAPSLMGEQVGGLATLAPLLSAGYAVLAPDLAGLGAPGPPSYLVGAVEGRTLLDAIRAVGRLPGVRVGASVLWGDEQGGHAALWAGQLAPDYAPDVRLAGVVAVAPLTDLPALLAAAISAGHAGALATDVVSTYADRYSDVRLADYTALSSRLVAEVSAHCAGERGPVGVAWAHAADFDRAWTLPAGSPLAARLAENTPTGPFGVPVLVVQGAADTVVPAAVQDDWVRDRCADGRRIEYRRLAEVDDDGVTSGSAAGAGILGWIGDRLSGHVDGGGCGT